MSGLPTSSSEFGFGPLLPSERLTSPEIDTPSPSKKRKRATAPAGAKRSRGSATKEAPTSWLPEHSEFIKRLKDADVAIADIALRLNEEFGLSRTKSSVANHLAKLRCKSFNWTPELEERLIGAARDFFEKKENRYNTVNGIFQMSWKPSGVEIGALAVVNKLKALERNGKIGKLT